MPFLIAASRRLEYLWIGPPPAEAPTLVFLHEGLGSVSTWKDFPAHLAASTGCGALVYSRWGHGRSDPLDAARDPRFMHEEALVTLPQILRALTIEAPILVGHSGGGSISLIYAGSGAPVRGLLLEAPHVFVEPIAVESIRKIRTAYETTPLAQQLALHHGHNTESMFLGWNDVWLSPGFRDWNIEDVLPAIRCPVLVIQGEQDEYGTARQLEAITRQAGGSVQTLMIPNCGHSPHRDQPDLVVEAMTRFVKSVIGDQ